MKKLEKKVGLRRKHDEFKVMIAPWLHLIFFFFLFNLILIFKILY